jgi:asparagine synthase (glutamine-hydrolysing)
MPGIVGLVTKIPRERAEPELLRMIKALQHETFYETGLWIDEALGVYVGWVARKNSFSDGMPLVSERGDVVLVFSGEEFPEAGTALRLKEQGHSLKPAGPSYLVHLYEENPNFPAGLNGRFHGLLADRRRGTATLFNDRYGIHRLYYHESKDAFYFAAEAKAILAVRPELRRADPRGLGELVACGCVLQNRSVFPGVEVLPGAAAWVFRDGVLQRKGNYFEPRDWEQQGCLEPEAYYRELRDVFSRNLPRYFNGQEDVGMSVTGGLDTRMIMAWKKFPPGFLPCYSFGGTFRECEDVLLARRLTSMWQQPHEVIPVAGKFLSHFPKYAERTVYLSDGCADVSRSPDLYVNERAREIAPVRMTGNYGTEVLRGVRPAFKPVDPPPGLFQPELLSQVRVAKQTYEAVRSGHPISFAVFRQAPWHHYGLLTLEQTQLSVRSPYLDNDLVRTVFRAPQSTLLSSDTCLRLIREGNPTLGSIRTDRGLGGNRGPLRRALARRWLEFTFKAEYAYDYGMPQWAARFDHLMAPLHMDRMFLGRHKFYHFRVWYRDELSNYVRDMLLDPRTLSRSYLQPKMVEAVVQGHLKGDRNYTTAIHKLLTLELLHRLLVDPR